MGLFDDPEMQLIGFEQAGVNNAKRFSPHLSSSTMTFKKPSTMVELDMLSGAPQQLINWNQSGPAHQDPTMYRFLKKDVPYFTRLNPGQDPEFLRAELQRLAKVYGGLTPEQISKLHYTDAASYPGTVDRQLGVVRRNVENAGAFLDRQMAIQDFRLSDKSANTLASEIEALGAQQRSWAVGQYGEEQNKRYGEQLARMISKNPELAKFLKESGIDFSNASTDILPTNEIMSVTEDTIKRRRYDTIAALAEWEQTLRKAGLGPEDTVPGVKNFPGRQRFNTGGFLLGVLGNAGELGMFGRLLKGGTPMIAGDGSDFDVMLPGEMSVIENAKRNGRGVYRNSEGVLEESPYREFPISGGGF
jgi:hypothetical protein